jgi:hypothetical protein
VSAQAGGRTLTRRDGSGSRQPRPRVRRSKAALPSSVLAASAIDRAYGLEPVFEPGASGEALSEFAAIDCPYCGERYETPIDLSAGSFRYVEDCQICCQPIDLAAEIGANGLLAQLTVRRLD